MLKTFLRCFQSLGDSPGNAAPSLGLGFELLPSGLGQAVVFRAAVVLGVSPKGGNPAFFLHSVQCGKERAWLDNKSAAGDLLDSARDSQAMHFSGKKRFQDQQVQGSLQKRCRFRIQGCLLSALYRDTYRMSIGNERLRAESAVQRNRRIAIHYAARSSDRL